MLMKDQRRNQAFDLRIDSGCECMIVAPVVCPFWSARDRTAFCRPPNAREV